jgi:hypothetical protein
METLRGNRKATTHLPVYRYGYISRLSGMNPQFMVSDHLSGIPTIRPSADLGRQTGCWLTILPRSEGPRKAHVNAMVQGICPSLTAAYPPPRPSRRTCLFQSARDEVNIMPERRV